MKKILFILILLSGASLLATAQIIFQQTYKTSRGGNGYCILQTTDGGYCAVGTTGNTGNPGGFDVYMIRTDAAGDTLWTRIFGEENDEMGWFFQQTADSGFIITGLANGLGSGNEEIYLIRTDLNGDTLWTKTLGDSLNDKGNCVQQTTDGGFIITGYTQSIGAGYDVCLIKTDVYGDVTWTKTFGGSGYDIGTFVQQSTDGGYIITGVTNSFGAGNDDLLLIKTDLNGNIIWQKTYGGASFDFGYAVQQTTDGGYITTGFTQSFGAGTEDLYLVKTDSIGDLMWSKTYGGADPDRGRSVQQTSDGGYILTGWAYSFASGLGGAEIYLVKTDTNGDLLWSNAIGAADADNARSVKQTADGGYILTGGTDNFGTGTYDVYFIKTDSTGNSNCNQISPPTVVTTPATQVDIPANITSIVVLPVNSVSIVVTSGSEVNMQCTNVGIDEMAKVNSFTVYPNPSTGDFVISFNEPLTNGTVEIINAIGENVYSENIFNESEVKINQRNISSGIYFVKVFDGRKSFSRKIVVVD